MSLDCIEIMQGDQYALPISLSLDNQPLTPSNLTQLEILIGSVRKTTPAVSYNDQTSAWEFPLLQSDTLAMQPGPVDVQVRAQFQNGDVIGDKVATIYVLPSASKEVLS